jgi:hypothetical protein
MLAWAEFILYTSDMTEWIVTGNRPDHIERELTPREQVHVDAHVAHGRLLEFAPERCRGCRALGAFVVMPLSYRLARGDTTKEAAITEVTDYVEGCTGPKIDEQWFDASMICPVDPDDERNRRMGRGYRA